MRGRSSRRTLAAWSAPASSSACRPRPRPSVEDGGQAIGVAHKSCCAGSASTGAVRLDDPALIEWRGGGNAIESVNARIRKAVRARGHSPSEAAALRCIYTALMSLDATGTGRHRWTMHGKTPPNAFQIASEGRLAPTSHWHLNNQDQPSS